MAYQIVHCPLFETDASTLIVFDPSCFHDEARMEKDEDRPSLHVGIRLSEGGKIDLQKSYRFALRKAMSYRLPSIALPLLLGEGISSRQSSEAALSEIRPFVSLHKTNVTLVISNPSDIALPPIFEGALASYLLRSSRNAYHPRREETYHTESYSTMSFAMAELIPTDLEGALHSLGVPFQTRLFQLIDERGMTDSEVYHKANLDRKLFSKIRCSKKYIPKKKNILAICFALSLSLDETKDLLGSAGYCLSPSSKGDAIVTYCLQKHIYDLLEVNLALAHFGEETLGC